LNQSLMSYIGSPEPQYGARKYTGSVATGYDAKRTESPKWHAEQAIIEGIIDSMPKGSLVLDVPVGTGRFVSAYERNEHKWFGVDMSSDMLAEASAKVTKPELAKLLTGDVTDLLIQDVDLSIMCRLTRWLSPEQRTAALKELQRVTTGKIVFTARIANHPYAYPIAAIEAAIEPGWKITENIEAGEPEYRVFVLDRV
jgi:ubiquinone/menaquinone biosynthesis C-methylase UbiE